MKLVDLSPEMVQAIVEMQTDAETLVALLEEVSEFVVDVDVEGQKEKAVKALQCLKNLRSVAGYCKPFIKQ